MAAKFKVGDTLTRNCQVARNGSINSFFYKQGVVIVAVNENDGNPIYTLSGGVDEIILYEMTVKKYFS